MSLITSLRRLPTRERTTLDPEPPGEPTAPAPPAPAGTAPAGTAPAGPTGSSGPAGIDEPARTFRPARTTADDPPGEQPAGRRWRRHIGPAVTVLAAALLVAALLLPNRLGRMDAAAFLRIPMEAILGVGLLLLVRPGARRPLAVLAGVALGLLTIVKVVDLGFYATLARPFDPVLDWVLLDDGVDFLDSSIGRAGAVLSVIGIVALALAVLALVTLAAQRVAGLIDRHGGAAGRAAGGAAAVWLACAALGVQLFPGVPVADRGTSELVHARAHQVSDGLRDQQAFAAQAGVDKFRNTPGDQLLTALRGKNVVVTFVESYGRSAVEDPRFARQVGALLDGANQRLGAKGYAARSGFLTSPTAGGGSWLAHATFASGLWINNDQRHRTLMASDRLTLSGAFQRADWDTVGMMPGVKRAWPEGAHFYGFNRVHDSRNMGYQGPRFSWARVPDQYTMAAFQRLEYGRAGRGPVMAEIALVSSHGPWAPIPRLIPWEQVGDGSVYNAIVAEGEPSSEVWTSATRVRNEYRRAIEYSLSSVLSYVETYGDDDLVLVFLGDHQPVPLVVGDGASRDVPITIVTRDRAVLDRISDWNWQDGLRPGPGAPVWRMDEFRDRFITAFSPRG